MRKQRHPGKGAPTTAAGSHSTTASNQKAVQATEDNIVTAETIQEEIVIHAEMPKGSKEAQA